MAFRGRRPPAPDRMDGAAGGASIPKNEPTVTHGGGSRQRHPGSGSPSLRASPVLVPRRRAGGNRPGGGGDGRGVEDGDEERIHYRDGVRASHYDEESRIRFDDDDHHRRRDQRADPSAVHTHAVSNLLRRIAAEIDRILIRVERMSFPAKCSLYLLVFAATYSATRMVRSGSFHAMRHMERKRIESGGGWAQPRASASSRAAADAVRKIGGKNVLSYSLYGSDPRYTEGALANARLVKEIYGPEWTMRVYHDDTVPKEILRQLKKDHGVELVDMSRMTKKRWWRGSGPNKMVWRFGVASDSRVNRYCIRDVDSRLIQREKAAVDEWIDSAMKFHVMRDHPSHSNYAMSGGLWCGTCEAFPDMVKILADRDVSNDYMHDMYFLSGVVWPVAKESVLQHDAFSCEEEQYKGSRPFPTKREGWEHVGGVYLNGQLRKGDVEVLRDAEQPEQCRDRDPNAGDGDARLGVMDGVQDNAGVEEGVWGGEWDLEEQKDKERSVDDKQDDSTKDKMIEGGLGISGGSWWDWLTGGATKEKKDGGSEPKPDADREPVDEAFIQQQSQEGPSETDPSKFCFRRAPSPSNPDKAPLERKGQITADTTFGSALRELAGRPEVSRVLEIGTWYGGGSTDILADGIRDKSNCDTLEKMHCCESFVITFEIYVAAWEHARVYHRDNPVWLVLGTTVGVDDMLSGKEIPQEEKGDHYKLYYQRDKKLMEKGEPQLDKYCRMVHPDVVLIDGNEYTGWADFSVSIKRCKPKFLALHDTNSLKTRKVEEHIKDNPDKFQLDKEGKDAASWAIYSVNYNEKPKKGSFRIVVVTSTKHESLKKLLDGLNAARYGDASAPIHLEIRIDHDDSHDHTKTVEVAESFDFDHGTKSVHKYETARGRQVMWFEAWRPKDSEERALILEDALEVSPLWYKWLAKAWKAYGARSDLGAISLCRQGLRASDGEVVKKEMDVPFLYKVPGSHGFSPRAKQWMDFLDWVKSVEDLKSANIDVKGTITTKWHRDGLDTWEQYWVWWCWGTSSVLTGPRGLYNLYVHPPDGAALIRHETDSATELLPPSSSAPALAAFPAELERFGWDYEVEGWLGGLGW